MSEQKKDGRKCRVYSPTINKYFESIEAAARFAEAKAWTMAVKMQAFGKFIDKDGIEYVRERPMDSKNVYKTPAPTIVKPKMSGCARKPRKKKETVVKSEETQKKTAKPKEESIGKTIIVNTNDVIITALNDKIVDLLKSKGIYEDVKKLSDAIVKLSKEGKHDETGNR